MKNIYYPLFYLFLLLVSCNGPKESNQTTGVETLHVDISEENGEFKLLVNGESYFIKGARTLRTRYMDKVAEYGGNSARIGYHDNVKEVLDEANRLGLSVLFGLPVKPERSGFDYDDEQAVKEQHNRMKEIVKRFKDHPAVLMWAIGNELDHVPGQETYNLKMWNAVNDIAVMIHELDPNHTAMTVIGTGRKEKLQDLMERCPDLDLLGINSYADIWEVPEWLRKYDWNKPFAVTEWGPSGHWQVPRTEWNVVIEQTSTEKAQVYKERYEGVIQSDPWCVGSYVFLWTSNRQERTHTWYNMFHDDGSEKGAVEVMHYGWTGEWPANRCPELKALQIDGLNALDDINLEAGSVHRAEVQVSDPDNDDLTVEWELVPENKKFGAYAGQGETKPEPVKGKFRGTSQEGKELQFEAPDEKGGNFRLFVYVHDGHNNAAVANIPFHVREE